MDNPDELDLDDDLYSDDQAETRNNDITTDTTTATMAATMGFTSFGGAPKHSYSNPSPSSHHPPTKKRRFNPYADDAVIAGPEKPAEDDSEQFYEEEDESTSKTNSIQFTAYEGQLHSTINTTTSSKPNPRHDADYPADAINHDDEIDYDDNDYDELAAGVDNHDFALDTTAGADATFESDDMPSSSVGTPQAQAQTQTQVLPGISTALPARGGGRGAGAGFGSGGRGAPPGRNPTWYVDYYDPSSNANPWEALEERLGMSAVGRWLSPRGKGNGSGNGSGSGGAAAAG